MLTVNADRLKKDLQALAEIGRWEDRGIYRMAFTDEDMAGRRWLIEQLEAAGIDTYQDQVANVFGCLNTADDRPSVLTGSHLDTVPAGGSLDGALGVVVGLECIRRIKEEGIDTRYGVELVAFSDEEGRFGGPLGSQALIGDLNPEIIHTATDLNGVKLTEAMSNQGLDPEHALDACRQPESVHAFLELHIEQGPVLDRKQIPIGVVEEITGLVKWQVRLSGAADHAGTTPMVMRRDAFSGLAEFAGEVPRILEEHGSDTSAATIGKVDLFPGSANVVPGEVEFSLDVRDTHVDTLAELADAFRRALSAIARRRDLMFEFEVVSEIEPVPCDNEIVKLVRTAAEEMDIPFLDMSSGAVHDAQIMAGLTRVGMIFVPSKDGRSHSPAEWTHWEYIETGANLTLNSLLKLAEAR